MHFSLCLDPSLPESSRKLLAEDFWNGLERPFAGNEIRVVIELIGFDHDSRAKAVLGDLLVSHSPHIARLTYLYRPLEATSDKETLTESDYEVKIFGGENENQTVGRAEWTVHLTTSATSAARCREGVEISSIPP